MGISVAWIRFDLFSCIQIICLQLLSWAEFDRDAQTVSWFIIF